MICELTGNSSSKLLAAELLRIDRVAAERHLSEFIRQAWHILEPVTEYIPNWHIDAICEHLEAVREKQIRNLLINMPPRHMKSLAVSVAWPVWEWITNPEKRWLFASYAQSLSTRDSLKCRRLIQSPWFQRRWGDRFQLTSDQNAKIRFENDRTGYRIATSVEGSNTGEGGDDVVVDDPHNVQEKESDAIRESTLIWWDETMSTRLNDPKTGSKIIVMQRVHEADLSGHVLKQGGYEHLRLPAEYEPSKKCVTSIGWEDPRTTEKELLWEERIGPKEITEFKTRLGPSGYAGQFQQRPAPAGGSIFKIEWFDVVDRIPQPLVQISRAWDFAATEESMGRDPDWTVGAKMGKTADGDYYILNVRRFRGSPQEVETKVLATAQADGVNVSIRIPQDPGSAGKSLAAHFFNVLAGYAVRAFPITGDKVTRANPLSATAERCVVHLLRGEWNDDFLDELSGFPTGSHDDQVDSVVDAFAELNGGVSFETGFYSITATS